jgi:WS/DGAT/MGAT family acyltransferase
MFIYGDTPSTRMHVAGLLPFTPPEDAGEQWFRDLEDAIRSEPVYAPWNLKLAFPQLKYRPLLSWVEDEHFDIDYHVRRSALPSAGGDRELGTLVSRLHSNPLDLSRPPWEAHIIEGLEGGRFALYVKVHHALVDGYTAAQTLIRTLADSADDRHTKLFFQIPEPQRTRAAVPVESGPRLPVLEGAVAGVRGGVDLVAGGVGAAARLGKRLVETNLTGIGARGEVVGSLQAPPSILNRRIGRNRRFAVQRFDLAELKAVGRQRDATLNDVVLSVLGGGLRRFLLELDALPSRPLIAFMPVNIRPEGDVGGGNSVGAILASMGTDVDDPLERLEAVRASTTAAKGQLEGMTQEQMLAYSAALMAPAGLQIVRAFTGALRTALPLTFNLCVSNVPGPAKPLYFRGARLEGSFPVSIPVHGMALNITVQSYVDSLDVGFIGCRDTLPHLQRLAVHAGDAARELLAAAG